MSFAAALLGERRNWALAAVMSSTHRRNDDRCATGDSFRHEHAAHANQARAYVMAEIL
jgi:hypothetical protein